MGYKNLSPEEKAKRLRRQWRESKRRRRTGEPPRYRRGQISRRPASELLYGPNPEADKSILVQQNARLPLDLAQRLDNAAEALKDKIYIDKTEIMIAGIEAIVSRYEQLYNNGKRFPLPPPGKGLRPCDESHGNQTDI